MTQECIVREDGIRGGDPCLARDVRRIKGQGPHNEDIHTDTVKT